MTQTKIKKMKKHELCCEVCSELAGCHPHGKDCSRGATKTSNEEQRRSVGSAVKRRVLTNDPSVVVVERRWLERLVELSEQTEADNLSMLCGYIHSAKELLRRKQV